jgi:hypothetical protein
MKSIFAVWLVLCACPAHAEDQTFHNPVDHHDYVAPGGWENYSPEGGVKSSTDKVALESVRLLQSQDEIGVRTSAEELSAFIKLAQSVAAEVFARYEKPATLMIQFTCSPGKHVVQLAAQGDPPQDLLQAYYDGLTKVKPLNVSAEVKFQFTLTVKP